MTPDLIPTAERLAPHAPRTTRRASNTDRLRVAEIARRLQEGESQLSAAWIVFSDPKIGLPRWRGLTQRPSDVAIIRKLAALLARTAPEVVATARDLAMARLAGVSEDAVRAVEEGVAGDFEDSQTARTRVDSARLILGALGVTERAGGMSVRNQVTVAFESARDAARRETEAMRELLLADPVAAEHARELGVRMARMGERDRSG
jgi:hypothetical protein